MALAVGLQQKVALRNVTKVFRHGGKSLVAVEDVSLETSEGELVTLIGPSGCGKSTLFNLIAGLEEPTHGSILIGGQELASRIGSVGYMFQKDLLVPWRNVLDNASLGLELAGMDKRRARALAQPLLEGFGLRGFERSYPHQLSGGMRQRAAFLRTALTQKDILLLDEPFGSLDALTRSTMQEWLLKVWERSSEPPAVSSTGPETGQPGMLSRKTILFITHDVEEAVFLSDRVYVMTARPGRIKLEVSIDLSRPRSYAMVTSQAFIGYKKLLQDALREEAARNVNGGREGERLW